MEKVHQQEGAESKVEQSGRDGDLHRKDAKGQQQHNRDYGVKGNVDIGDDIQASEKTDNSGDSQPGTNQSNCETDTGADYADSNAYSERVVAAVKLADPDLQSDGSAHHLPPPEFQYGKQRQAEPGCQTD